MAEQHQPPAKGTQSQPDKADKSKAIPEDGLQGEGNYDAARRYREEVGEFVKTADIDKAAHDAAPKNEREAEDMANAEATGRSKRKN